MAKILIVEDEKMLSEAYELVLKNDGHAVATAANGEEGLLVFKKFSPQLILLDLRMPKMDGIDFLKTLNPSKNHPEVDILVFSNYDDPKEIDEAFKHGATRYILKAWSSPAELVKVVQETLQTKKTRATAKSKN